MGKIRIVHYGLSRGSGGVEASILRNAELINKERFELHFLITKGESVCYQEQLAALGGIFHEITARRVSIHKNRRDLDRVFRTERFDVLHMHLNTLSYIAPVWYARKHGTLCLIHSRNSGATRLRVRIFHFINRVLQPKKNVMRVAVSRQAGKWLFGKASHFEVVPNGINTKKYAFDEQERALGRKELGLNNDCLVLGYVAVFLPVKNHTFLIDIAEVLSKRGVNFAMILIGAGPEMEPIKMLANKKKVSTHVKFLGARADLGRLYSAMDALVFPSKFEGFGNVVLEAQASGLPCFVSTAVPNELVLSDLCQILDLRMGVEAWASALMEVETEAFENRAMAAQRIARSDFSVGSEVARLEGLYATMMEARSEEAPAIHCKGR